MHIHSMPDRDPRTAYFVATVMYLVPVWHGEPVIALSLSISLLIETFSESTPPRYLYTTQAEYSYEQFSRRLQEQHNEHWGIHDCALRSSLLCCAVASFAILHCSASSSRSALASSVAAAAASFLSTSLRPALTAVPVSTRAVPPVSISLAFACAVVWAVAR